MINVITTQI